MRQILVIGDIHGRWVDFGNELTKKNISNVDIIHVGDGGYGFLSRTGQYKALASINEVLAVHDIVLYNIRGNHDNPYWFMSKNKFIRFLRAEDRLISPSMQDDMYYLYEYMAPISFADKVLGFSNIKLVPDYTVLELSGRKILCIGGAISVDRYNRTNGRDYFVEENLVYKPSVLKKLRGIDMVVTHTVPDFLPPALKDSSFVRRCATKDKTLLSDLHEERLTMTKIYEDITAHNTIKMWAYGHMHKYALNIYNDIKFICVPPNTIHSTD